MWTSINFPSSLPSPCIVNVVAPSKLPVVGVIWVTRPPENKKNRLAPCYAFLRIQIIWAEKTGLSRIIESVPSYLELQIERIKELLQTEIRPFFGSSSPCISFVSKIDEMLPWTKLCDVSFGYRLCCSVNRFKNVIQRLTSRLQLNEQLTRCGVKGQIQLCIALWLSDFSLQVLSQLLNYWDTS